MGTGKADQRPLGAAGRLGVVVAMHAALLFLLVRGMGVQIPVIEKPGDIETRLIDRPKIDPVPTPIDPPRNAVPIWIPEPDHPPVEQDPPVKDQIIISGTAVLPRITAPASRSSRTASASLVGAGPCALLPYVVV